MLIERADPSIGIDAETGGTITGWEHVLQSLRDVFLTAFGDRWHRESYGSLVPQALGRNITRQEMLPVMASITAAVEQFEPRFLVVEVVLDGGEARAGRLGVVLRGFYRPRALLGDMTPEGAERSVTLGLYRDNVTTR